jgi:spore coat protein U-like protein
MRHPQTLQIGLLFVVVFLTTPLYAICKIDSVNAGNFGTVTTQNDIANQHVADITVSCDSDYLLGLDAGFYPAGFRQLNQSGHLIPYRLFQGATASEWGSQGLIAANIYPMPALASGSGSNITHSIYASALTQDKNLQGIYNDNVTVILADSTGTLLSTATLNFNLNLIASCTLDTSSFAGFGSYPLGSTRLLNADLGFISVNCPASISYEIGIDKGLHLAGNMRQIALNESAFIPYILRYGANEWGDTGIVAIDNSYTETFPALAVSAIGTGVPQNFIIHGDAWIENATAVGTYTDTLIVTLVW